MFTQGILKTCRNARHALQLTPELLHDTRHAEDVARAVEDFRAILRRERALAYRLNYGFSFVMLRVSDAFRAGLLIDTLLPAFRQRLRETDVTGLLAPDTLGVILPRTTVQQARQITCGICRATGDHCELLRCMISDYPESEMAKPFEGSGDAPRMSAASAQPEVRYPVHVVDAFLSGRVPVWKRALDISVAGLTLLVFSPVMAFMALTIKLVSPGPVLFRQPRIGHLGQSFQCFKFRSMHLNSDSAVHARHLQTLIQNGQQPLQKLDAQADPRIIPLGRFFRASGLDELPQLFNVLRGEMSLVGPRPCVAYEFLQFQDWQKRRCETPPGLTGFWQVNGKNKTTFIQMMRFDLAYVQKRAFFQDVISLLRTPAVVLNQIVELCRKPRAVVRPRGES